MSNFLWRHIGPDAEAQKKMLSAIGVSSVDALMEQTIPADIRLKKRLDIAPGQNEEDVLEDLLALAKSNRVSKSYQGTGYYPCFTPGVIQRNVLENPGWYTQYTPYQAEISQGRLEALINFQTMVCDLTALPVANASLLDEGTALAEAMMLAWSSKTTESQRFFVSKDCHPQSLAVVQTRAEPLNIQVVVGDPKNIDWHDGYFGVALQVPGTDGVVRDWTDFSGSAHGNGAVVIMCSDLLALTLIKPPGEMGADIAVGSAQRFGVPMGFGGPHAAFMATKESFTRKMPGRLIGVSKDLEGRNAFRLSLQTREQHIRREKATSNICTAQVLLAIMASFYAVYHGADGLKGIARRVHRRATFLADQLKAMGMALRHDVYFDTLRVAVKDVAALRKQAEAKRIGLRYFDGGDVGISLNETTSEADVRELVALFASSQGVAPAAAVAQSGRDALVGNLARASSFLTHDVFCSYHSETEMLRYIKRLEAKDLSLAHSMIPLGSCTMKLNATTEMLPVTWPEFAHLHPHAPAEDTRGYREMFQRLEKDLAELTGFAAVSLQPNAGSQGEYAGLLVIRKYHQSRGERGRDVCLIPKSAHGTNPASAAMAGMKVVVVECDRDGNIDLPDLRKKASEHSKTLAAIMVTYPSTHGVFETAIREICDVVHQHGGLVYMDGANMNAQIGLCRPGDFGPDVCHLNLHKTFCIPHGGGGPGMGPIGVTAKLAEFLPGRSAKSVGPVSSAEWGSASILPIPYAYIRMMGFEGLKHATEVAILSANYIAMRLDAHFPVLYRGASARVAHECILDLRPIKAKTGIEVEDVAKRLMDYGFHAPTISFPVPGTVMIEPTESESLAELDRFCDAMIAIREEIAEIESGKADPKNNVLKHAPHTASVMTQDTWDRPYSRQKAAFPLPWVKARKFWPSVSRIDAVGGDRNFVCTCPPLEDYA